MNINNLKLCTYMSTNKIIDLNVKFILIGTFIKTISFKKRFLKHI